jgi:hypothetical protein
MGGGGLAGSKAGEGRAGPRSVRPALGMMIVLVLAADVTALMTIEPGAAGDGDGAGGEGRAKETSVAAEAIQTTTAPVVLAVEDFSPGTAAVPA